MVARLELRRYISEGVLWRIPECCCLLAHQHLGPCVISVQLNPAPHTATWMPRVCRLALLIALLTVLLNAALLHLEDRTS